MYKSRNLASSKYDKSETLARNWLCVGCFHLLIFNVWLMFCCLNKFLCRRVKIKAQCWECLVISRLCFVLGVSWIRDGRNPRVCYKQWRKILWVTKYNLCHCSLFRPVSGGGEGSETVLGRIVNLDRIPNTEYVRVLKMDRIRILNSAIRSKLFE